MTSPNGETWRGLRVAQLERGDGGHRRLQLVVHPQRRVEDVSRMSMRAFGGKSTAARMYFAVTTARMARGERRGRDAVSARRLLPRAWMARFQAGRVGGEPT